MANDILYLGLCFTLPNVKSIDARGLAWH